LIIGILLAVCILGIIGYFAYEAYNNQIKEAQQISYEQGIVDAATYIAIEAAQCKQVPLNISNQIVTLVSVDCLR
jgi:archaellum component FlaF (FlaF/FlaG flagellin family)